MASADHGEREAYWNEAFEYYQGEKPLPPEDPDEEDAVGYSTAVSMDVSDAVEAVLAEILPAFTQAAPVEFDPLGPEDEAHAQAETDAVNHVANTRGLYMALNHAAKDALLRRAGCIKVYWEERAEVAYEQHSGIPLAAAGMVLQPSQPREQVDILEAEMDEMESMASGVVRRTRIISRPRLDPVPVDELLVSSNAAYPDANEARFIAHQRPMPRSELVELGVPKDTVDALRPLSDTQSGSRDRSTRDAERETGHESTESIMVVEAYYRIDRDGDGIAELLQIVTAGGSDGTDELMWVKHWDEPPFAIGVAYTGLYSWEGVSLFDKLKSVQDLKTDMLRDIRNMLARALRQRLGVVEDDADMGDVISSVLGGAIRCRTPNGVFPINEGGMPPGVFEMLSYLDKQRADQGGAAIDRSSQTMPVGADTAHGLERMMSAQEARNAMIARNLAETLMKPLFRKLHKLLRQYQTDPMRLPGTSGWRIMEPAMWEPRQDMTISMGMSVGERSRRLGALNMVIQQQMGDMQTGAAGILSNQRNIYSARMDMARLGGLPNPDQYFLDPASQESQQAQQGQAQQAQQAAQMQVQQQQQMMEFQYKLMTDIERVKAEAKLASEQMAAATKRISDQLAMAEKMFGHRVDIAKIEADLDKQNAQKEVDMLQATATEKGKTDEGANG